MSSDSASHDGAEPRSDFAGRHLSLSAEHFTPPRILKIVRVILGGLIDLDPASCAKANVDVQAEAYYDRVTDGFSRPWWGKVFLNPPGGRHADGGSSQKAWWHKLAEEYEAGRVSEAVFLSFSVELLQTSQSAKSKSTNALTPMDYVVCFPARRIAYVREDGTVGASPPHSSCLVYLGTNVPHFVNCTKDLGRCMRRMKTP